VTWREGYRLARTETKEAELDRTMKELLDRLRKLSDKIDGTSQA
jgi:hypothetical protein